jgi:hypothetical protein
VVTHLLALGLILQAPVQGADSQAAFASARTEAIVRLAQARHAAADTSVRDYQSSFRTRMTFAFGRRKWARIPPLAAEEQVGVIRWQQPNDIQIEMVGRRSRARDPEMDIRSIFDEPWFVPRAMSDSVRLAGADFPETAAIHPLAAGGPDWYRYEVIDSAAVRSADGDVIRLIRVTVTPRRAGVALVLGYLMLDAANGEVVRFSFRFVGTDFWFQPDEATREDSAEAREANKWTSRLVSLNADLEYSLQDRSYWMPYRQTITGSIEIPFVSDAVVPFSFTTTFDDYEVNTGRPIAFRLPPVGSKQESDSLEQLRNDSLRAEYRARREAGEDAPDSLLWKQRARDVAGVWGDGGRYEVHIPPTDSLDHHAGWTDSMVLDDADYNEREQRELQAELASLAERLPNELTGRRPTMFAVEQIGDIFRYTKVQGLSAGLGYRVPFFGVPFTTVFASARFGFADERLYGRLALIRDAPGGRWTLAGYRDLPPADVFLKPRGLANSINAAITTHDEADYFLAMGGSLSYEASLGIGTDLTLTGRVEDQSSVASEAKSFFNDIFSNGLFDPNPAIAEGTFGGFTARLDGRLWRGRWTVAADLLAGAPGETGKIFGELRQPLSAGRAGLTLTARAGIATDDPLPQSAFRVGGLATVRGFPYGAIRDQAFWAVQSDFGVGRGGVRPVLFLDAGQGGPRQDFFDREVLVGGGGGLSFFNGLMRFDVSFPITPSGGDPRFDIVFLAPR